MNDDRRIDEHLVSRAKAGSRQAADELIERHWRPAWRVARGITGDAGLAEDVVQESMVSALHSLNRFDPSRAAFGTWLHRITVNRALNARRTRRHAGLDEAATVASEQVEHLVDASFLAAIAGLRPAHRAVVVLRYGLDYSPPEIAEVLEIAVGTVNSRLARALETLRETMESPHAL
jgi:RNA polymerase sigma-70 factor, ECF subfamily